MSLVGISSSHFHSQGSASRVFSQQSVCFLSAVSVTFLLPEIDNQSCQCCWSIYEQSGVIKSALSCVENVQVTVYCVVQDSPAATLQKQKYMKPVEQVAQCSGGPVSFQPFVDVAHFVCIQGIVGTVSRTMTV